MKKNWRQWQHVFPHETTGPVRLSSLGAATSSDYFQALLAALDLAKADLKFEADDFRPDVLKALDYGVFRRSDLGSHREEELRSWLKFGTGKISDFVSWSDRGRAAWRMLLADGRSVSAPKSSRIRLLLVDDSNVIHKLMEKWAKKYPEFEIVGNATDAVEAERMRNSLNPDVVVLDIHMEGQDGIAYLQDIMHSPSPSRVVMMSSITREHATKVLHAFELGAIDYIEKPEHSKFADFSELIAATLRAAAHGNVRKRVANKEVRAGEALTVKSPDSSIILLGASTGGTEALRAVLSEFPSNCPATLVVQHIPPVFSAAFVGRLNEVVAPTVIEASDGLPVRSGHVYVAPGGMHMKLALSKGRELVVRVTDDPPVNLHRPSVDYLFNSVAELKLQKRVCAALMTGMGSDGAKGLLALKEANAHTIAQDEATCVVFGMPGVAIKLGAAREVVPLPSIAYHLIRSLTQS